MSRHYLNCVKELKVLLKKHEKDGWEKLLVDSITEAKALAVAAKVPMHELLPGDLDGYFKFLHHMVHWIPREDVPREVFYMLCSFYWLIDQPPGRKLQTFPEFNQWMHDFARDWGSFLNTTDSAKGIQTFLDDPDFHPDEYMHNPSGWLTFNQFFAREVKPGLRPVIGITNDDIITSPADSTFKEKFPIDDRDEITVKHTHRYKILDLLEGSPYRDRFAGGLFMHSFLGPNDYHRFRAPVRGTVLECRAITGRVYLDVQIQDGDWSAPDGAGYEFTQERGLIIQDSPVGLVATLPIGMAQVSSVNMTAVVGAYLNKGEEFGYFMFGGSDIIMLFEADSGVEITAAPGIHYNCGMGVGEVIY